METTPESDEGIIRRLVRALDFAEGFWLGFAKSDTPAQRRRLAALCKDLLEPLDIRVLEIELAEPITDLLPVLRERLAQEGATPDENISTGEAPATTRPKLAIFVHGLERSIPSREAYPPLLSALNLKRELFRQEVLHPLLLWLPDYALTALARKAPDFWAWRSGLYEFAPEREAAEQLLKAVRGRATHVIESLSEQAKRERLAMLQRLLDDYREMGDGPREQGSCADILNEIGLMKHSLGEWAEAERVYEESLTILRHLKDSAGEAGVLHNMAAVAQDRGKVEDARRLYGKSLKIKTQLGDETGVAGTLHELGRLAQGRGETEEARRLYGKSLEIAQRLGDEGGAAATLLQFAVIAQDRRDVKEARRLYGESLKIAKRLGDESNVAVILHNLATLAQGRRGTEEARRLYGKSLEIARRLGDESAAAATLLQLGALAEEEGDGAEAVRLFREALSIFERLGSPDAEVARRRLAKAEASPSAEWPRPHVSPVGRARERWRRRGGRL